MNKILIGVACGIAFSFFAAFLIGYLVISSGIIPARQDEAASNFEAWAAEKSLFATIEHETAGLKNPISADEKNLAVGAKLYEANCAICHGAPMSPSTMLSRAYSPPAPSFVEENVSQYPEENLYWIVDHGIRFTGMPAFNRILNEEELWQVVTFLKHLDKLPPSVDKTWKKMKYTPPAQLQAAATQAAGTQAAATQPAATQPASTQP